MSQMDKIAVDKIAELRRKLDKAAKESSELRKENAELKGYISFLKLGTEAA